MEQGRAGNLATDLNCSKSPEEISVGREEGRGCPLGWEGCVNVRM